MDGDQHNRFQKMENANIHFDTRMHSRGRLSNGGRLVVEEGRVHDSDTGSDGNGSLMPRGDDPFIDQQAYPSMSGGMSASGSRVPASVSNDAASSSSQINLQSMGSSSQLQMNTIQAHHGSQMGTSLAEVQLMSTTHPEHGLRVDKQFHNGQNIANAVMNDSFKNTGKIPVGPVHSSQVAAVGHNGGLQNSHASEVSTMAREQPEQVAQQLYRGGNHDNSNNALPCPPLGSTEGNIHSLAGNNGQLKVNAGTRNNWSTHSRAQSDADEKAMLALQAQLSSMAAEQHLSPQTQVENGHEERRQHPGSNAFASPMRDPAVEREHPQYMPQRNALETPIRRRRGTVNSDSFTPTSYVNSPLSNFENSFPASPAVAAGRMPIRTEPRDFAPRGGPIVMNEPPPRFALNDLLADSEHDFDSPSPHRHTHGRAHAHSQSCGNFFAPTETGGSNGNGNAPVSDGQQSGVQSIEMQSQALVVREEHSVPEYIRQQRSKELNDLTAGPKGLPTADVALHIDNFPFIEGARAAQPSQVHGVVKLKSIPLSTTRSEIVAMLGRNAKILNDSQEPIHIIMERVTSKTGCAYVEFMSVQAAMNTVDRHQKIAVNGRLPRLGDRPVDMELSGQAALMQDLFPLAKGVRWDGATPIILEAHPSQPWRCFKGFITEEEMTVLVKCVEIPQRSPFTKDCPQRPYEAIISILRKFPWYMTECITVKQREAIYSTCVSLLRYLQHAIRERKNESYLTPQLYRRLWTSAMLCHGFTVTMKDSIAWIVNTLVPKPGTPLDVIEWYIAIIREETNRTVGQSMPNIQDELRREGQNTSLYWGYFFKELSLPYGEAFDNMTLAEQANREFFAVSNILRRALPQ